MVANAFISGRNPSLIREKMRIGRVLDPGPVTKLAITRSSSESVKAKSQPDNIRRQTGQGNRGEHFKGFAPRSEAASSKVSPAL